MTLSDIISIVVVIEIEFIFLMNECILPYVPQSSIYEDDVLFQIITSY